MKATIDFDERLYRRLKIEAARRGRTIRDLVDEGVRTVLGISKPESGVVTSDDPPAWFGALAKYAENAEGDHSMEGIRRSIVRGRSGAG